MQKNRITAVVFIFLTLLFIVFCIADSAFFEWVFARHHNKWSWYIRPLFLVPFCIFAYRRNLAGVAITIFCLFTSMFWFNEPATVNDDVKTFLQFEKDWLYGEWNVNKLLLILTVPLSLFALALACWKRSLFMVLAVVVLMATGKVVWSIYNSGEAGRSVVLPAVTGLVVCVILICAGFLRLQKADKKRRGSI